MRIPRNRKLALHLTLWVVAGIILITLPALLAPSTSKNAETPVFGTRVTPSTASTTTVQSPSPIASPQPAAIGNGFGFVYRFILVLMPTAILSILVKTWAHRRFVRNWD